MSDVQGLRKLSNDIKNCVRNLKAMDVETATYGSLLIPILKGRLPDELVVEISRRFGCDIWTLDLVLKYMNDEIQANENCVSILKNSSANEKKSQAPYSAYAFQTNSEKEEKSSVRNCVYCSKDGHSPSKCHRVTNVQSRVEILKSKRRCFLCLDSGHQKNECNSKYICRNCNGKHHISICYGKKDVQTNQCSCSKEKGAPAVTTEVVTSTARESDNKSILLQTATAEICGSGEVNLTRILFDSGSQRSYITESLCESLKLRTVRKERVVIKTFGESEGSEAKVLRVVKFKVKHKNSSRFTFVEALCVPQVCGKLRNQNSFSVTEFSHVKNLTLADEINCSIDRPVGVLVGIDFYYDFFTGRISKGKVNEPVASETHLGWVLSGKVLNSSDQLGEESNCFHAMKCFVEPCDLKANLERFWEVEKIGEKDDCVITQFERDIFHNGKRYVTTLPFKPGHDTIPDNFITCKKKVGNSR